MLTQFGRPQCQPSAISHLCKTCNVSTLFYESSYEALATAAESVDVTSLPCLTGLLGVEEASDKIECRPLSSGDIAYLHHTSGTSTGLPKPIPQSHHAGVGVLPRLTNGFTTATFSTTPLYHGGVADCFRAWTSGAMIWLFPGKDVPITASNIIQSLDVAKRNSTKGVAPEVKYFSSVPYVLQMLASENQGLKYLIGMDIVGVGGAALPTSAGDALVDKGINLISRFGSAECGFLMSSHRDYERDNEWQYLRSVEGSRFLNFELQNDGLGELVVLPGWPHMAKRNREGASYATADLFEPHKTLPNAWKYHSRADSQLTLVTGKKFDPAPMEATISSSSPLLQDVLIFGNGESYPGALLFASPTANDMSRSRVLEAVWPEISTVNNGTQGHAKLTRTMLIIMPYENDAPLEKSSKGTILRVQAEKRYAENIRRAYDDSKMGQGGLTNVPDERLLGIVSQIIRDVTGLSPDVNSDLFHHGVDSVACIQIRDRLGHLTFQALPINVVYDCGTIKAVEKFLIDHRKGQVVDSERDDIKLMRELVAKYGNFDVKSKPSTNGKTLKSEHSKVVVLTGATGALGAHVLSLFRSDASVLRVYCLLRASSDHAARERVTKGLENRQLPSLDSDDSQNDKIICIPSKLADPQLGLPPSVYDEIRHSATTIIHAAWAVNFTLRLRSFEQDHVAGTRHLLDLARSCVLDPCFCFCSSTASTLGPAVTSPVAERVYEDPNAASPLGYSRSKWVAEQLCSEACKQTDCDARVLRIGQLCGDTTHGVWNKTEAWPLMLSSVTATNCLPNLTEETLGWLPVDIAATAVVEIALRDHDTESSALPVYHILNPDHSSTWEDLLSWVRESGTDFEIVEPHSWVQRLEAAKDDHPAKKLLGMWKSAYTGEQDQRDEKGIVEFQMSVTQRATTTMRNVEPIGKHQAQAMWAWIQRETRKV